MLNLSCSCKRWYQWRANNKELRRCCLNCNRQWAAYDDPAGLSDAICVSRDGGSGYTVEQLSLIS